MTRITPTPGTDHAIRSMLVRASTADEASRTVQAIIATERPVAVMDPRTFETIDEVLVADGMTEPASGKAPLLDAHDRSTTKSIVGSVSGFATTGGEVRALLALADDNDSLAVWRKISGGHLDSVSVGYGVRAFSDIQPGQTRSVAGRQWTAGSRRLRITTAWDLREVSVVPIGADELAKIRSRNAHGRPSNMNTRTRDMGAPTTRTELTAAMIGGLKLRAGMDLVDPAASPAMQEYQHQLRGQAAGFAGRSLIEVARCCLEIDRGSPPYGMTDLEVIEESLRSATLSEVFNAVADAHLMAGFEGEADSAAGWVDEVDIANYKTREVFSVDTGEQLDVLPRGKRANEIEFRSEKETYKPASFAKRWAIDDQAILNDHIGAITAIPEEVGRAAQRTRLDSIFQVLLANAALNEDSVALFDAAHNNTAALALDAPNLETAIAAVSNQRFGDRPLNLKPRFLIVNPKLLMTGGNLLRVYFQHDDPNRLELRSDSRLGVSGLIDPRTGGIFAGSQTMWYLATANRNIEVGYVRGRRRPLLREFILSGGRWGFGFDVEWSFGVKALGYRGLYRGNV